MSTRSEIGILNKDGTVTSIYCHWDGYPEYNGVILSEYYTKEEIVKELIKNGDLSSLHESISPDKGMEHSLENPQEDVCVYYHRDIGEEWEQVMPKTYSNIKSWVKEVQQGWQEYMYLFKNGKWYCTTTYKVKWTELKKATTMREHDSSNATPNN